mgnify:FL=1|tara:strand:+ start:16353 stop:17696 length:1344 start_codon:yes stop_codon:yes gene_type:complete
MKSVVQDPIEIKSLTHEGRGIGEYNGKKIFIDGALANELVKFKILRNKSKFIEGIAEEILEKSPRRVDPACKHFMVCGGCSLQHMSEDMQREIKQSTLKDNFLHFGNNVSPNEYLEPITDKQYGYRRKARLGVKYVIKKDKVLVGFREKNGRFLADIDSCPILYSKVSDLLVPLQELIFGMEARQQIPQIEVAVGDTDIALIFRNLVTLDISDKEKLINFAEKYNINLFLQPKGPDTVYRIYPLGNNENYLEYSLPDLNLSFKFLPTDFTQVNLNINRKLVNKALELLDINNQDVILDLFSGLGNFTLPMAKFAKKVIAVEGSDAMVQRGYLNAKNNNIDNIDFYATDLINLEEANKKSDYKLWFNNSYNKILLDPPRAGAKEIIELLHTIKDFNIEKIVYVSCNPATLARDAGILVNDYNYKMTKAGILDMFPNTKHVESMAVFEK